jgi:hypothetical protein
MNHAAKIKLIKTLADKGHIAKAVELCICANLERQEGTERGFFMDNASGTASEAGISAAQFAGALGAMEKAGKYKPSQDPEYKGHYGYLICPKIED